MEIGDRKHGDITKATTAELYADLLRKAAEFIIAGGSGDSKDLMEAIADISNLCEHLYPKVQRDYVDNLRGPIPDCIASEDYNSLQCRSEPCAWRGDCKSMLEAEVFAFMRSLDYREKDRFSTRME